MTERIANVIRKAINATQGLEIIEDASGADFIAVHDSRDIGGSNGCMVDSKAGFDLLKRKGATHYLTSKYNHGNY